MENKIPKFKYDPPKDIWDKYLVHQKSTYKKECKQKRKVLFKTTVDYIPHNKRYEKGKEYTLDNKAITELLDYKVIELR